MDINEQAMRALDVLESSEVLHEFDDSVTLRVDRELWNDCILFMKQDAEWEAA